MNRIMIVMVDDRQEIVSMIATFTDLQTAMFCFRALMQLPATSELYPASGYFYKMLTGDKASEAMRQFWRNQ